MSKDENKLSISEESSQSYKEFVEKLSPKTSIIRSLALAFIFGGLICILGQGITDLLNKVCNVDLESAKLYSLSFLIFAAIALTAFGVFDDLARLGGAGLFLPITGFANAVASAGIEFKSEGMIFGLGTKMFTVAGPVIVNGIVFGTLAGIIHYIISLF